MEVTWNGDIEQGLIFERNFQIAQNREQKNIARYVSLTWTKDLDLGQTKKVIAFYFKQNQGLYSIMVLTGAFILVWPKTQAQSLCPCWCLFVQPMHSSFWLSLPSSLNSKIQGCARLCGAFRLREKEAVFIDGAGFKPRASEVDALSTQSPDLGYTWTL